MSDQTSVETCRWAKPTVRAPYPFWLDAEDKAWTCFRDEQPRPLDDPAVCHGCPRWEPHRVHLSELPPR